MLQSEVWIALGFGALSALPLPLGAAAGLLWRPPDRVIAFLLAFGGGALLAALTLDLVAPGVSQGHFDQLAIGALLGGVLFKGLDVVVNRQGGYLRKPSTAMSYWRGKARRRLADALRELHRTRHLSQVDDDTLAELLEIVLVEQVGAGTILYRPGEPPSRLYIVERGSVELTDPDRDGEVFERLGKHDVFGRLSFITGLPRATGARTAEDCVLLVVPRAAFLDYLATSAGMRRLLVGLVEPAEVETYLVTRHGLSPEEAAAWRDEAAHAVVRDGRYEAPFVSDEVEATALLADERRIGLLSGLPYDTVARLAAQTTKVHLGASEIVFQPGEKADRLLWVLDGAVRLDTPGEANGSQVVAEGDGFGHLAFVTEARHSVSAVATEPTTLVQLRRADFLEALAEDEQLRRRVSDFVRSGEVSHYLVGSQHLASERAARWVDKASRSIRGNTMTPSIEELTQSLAGHRGAAMAMFLGILLDGIPESFVIGANVLVAGTLSLSLLAGLFLANLPEALSSAVGMREQGLSARRIMTMWTTLMVLTGLGAALGTVLLAEAPGTLFALIEGIAAGAMLTMVAETMLPEAYHKGAGVVGLSTLAGFLTAVFLNQVG